MREARSRAFRPRSDLTSACAALLACALVYTAGCATEISPLEPRAPAEQTIDGGAPGDEGGGANAAGNASTAGKPSGGAGGSSSAGGTGVNGPGGAASTGGKGGGSSSGTAGTGGSGSPQGGNAAGGKGGASSGGMSPGGSGGMTPGGTGGGSAGTASGGSAGGSGLGCLSGWKGSACDTCSTQTQGDKLGCVKILECYEANSCGPATCANNDDKCGVNKMSQGTAGYPIAKDVYDCACP